MIKIAAIAVLATTGLVAITAPIGGLAARHRAIQGERVTIVCDLVGCVRRGG